MRRVNVSAFFQNRACQPRTQDVSQRVAKSKPPAPADAAQNAGRGAAKSNQIIATVCARAQDRVAGLKLFQGKCESRDRNQRRVGTYNQQGCMRGEQFLKRIFKPRAKIAATLKAKLKWPRSHSRTGFPRGNEHVFCDFRRQPSDFGNCV